MERIQEALAKARAQREKDVKAKPETYVLEKEVLEAEPRSPKDVSDLWRNLNPIKLDRGLLRRKRVVAVESGFDAAPYDVLRTKIMRQAEVNGWRRVAIVSPDPGAGKTTTLANLAFSFERQRDMRVMCLDLDLRRPFLAKVLGQQCDHSMADVFDNRVSFEEHGRRLGEKVAFGFNNGPVGNPSELLLSREARECINGIEQNYAPDLIFFDISPLNTSDDNIAFLQNVDCAVIIAAAEATPMKRIDDAERQVAELTNVMGIVLNKCRYVTEDQGYAYY